MDTLNRRALLQDSRTFNGIDFIEVADDTQRNLRIHFINRVKLEGEIGVSITGGERIPDVAVNVEHPEQWTEEPQGEHRIVELGVDAPGDFSNYLLTLRSSNDRSGLDPFFNHALFSFKARCPSDLDCRPAPFSNSPPASNAPPIDYVAKDFLSFRQALLDFSALRYPEWQERSQADFGVMFLEALCALADDLSFMQDRITAEAALETATQRRSAVRLARLVEYEPRPALAARVLLQFDVASGTTMIPEGTIVTARGPDGATIPFETGNGIASKQPAKNAVHVALNSGIPPYWFDDSQRCLQVGATQMFVRGSGLPFRKDDLVLIETTQGPGEPPLRQIVRLVEDGEESFDPLVPPPPPALYPGCEVPHKGTAIMSIRWRAEDKLLAARDLTKTKLAGNLIEATQGLTQAEESFAIPMARATRPNRFLALVRTGANNTLQYLYPLRSPGLVWLPQDDPEKPPLPEILLRGKAPGDGPVSWTFVNSLLAAGPLMEAYTIDPAQYSRVAGTPQTPYFDYDGDKGQTIRFGDGAFGARPLPDAQFTVAYRVGLGAAGNVAADSITQPDPKASGIKRVTNPFPAEGGTDEEPLERVRRRAPEAFRAEQYRVVLPRDYSAAAEKLSWVQRAGAVFRWTGSWLTAFTTPDPLHSEQITADQRIGLIRLLNRQRMAGYESYVNDPKYVSISLLIEVCARPDAFRADVKSAVLRLLGAGTDGFFNPNNLTFGQPLERSSLEAAVQQAHGVAGVLCVRFRVAGRTAGFTPLTEAFTVAPDEIIRCDNDPNLPERGSLHLTIEGGK